MGFTCEGNPGEHAIAIEEVCLPAQNLVGYWVTAVPHILATKKLLRNSAGIGARRQGISLASGCKVTCQPSNGNRLIAVLVGRSE